MLKSNEEINKQSILTCFLQHVDELVDIFALVNLQDQGLTTRVMDNNLFSLYLKVTLVPQLPASDGVITNSSLASSWTLTSHSGGVIWCGVI